jgi:LemA protein
MRKLLMTLVVLVAGTNLSGCGSNKLQGQDESVKAAWSEVVNQYQRRADLIPNLVATVKGFAAQEERVLVGVTEARARATSIQLTPELLNNPQAFQQFQQAQGQLTQALKSLLVTVERYPELKSDANFRDLQAHHRGAQPLHRRCAPVQRHRARVPDHPDRQDVRLRGEAELHGSERGRGLQRTGGELRHDHAVELRHHG